MALVTVDALKSEVKSYTYAQLTEGDDTVAERAIEKARIWVSAKLARLLNADFDEDGNTTDYNIILKRSLYELYSYGEMEAVASDKKDDAFELLKAKYGNIDGTNQPSGSGGEEGSGPSPAGHILQPEINKDSF